MRVYSLLKWVKSYPALCLTVLCIVLGSSILLYAHSGPPIAAPTKVSSSIVINGDIAEAVWSPGVPADNLANNCNEFVGAPPPPPVTVFALNDGVNLYLAFDIPDSTADPNDMLFLFFDPNHGGGASPAVDDRAFRLTFDNTAANNTVPSAEHFSGTGAGWSAGTAGLPAGVEAKYTRHTAGTGKWQIEMRFPFTGPTVGFAFQYFNETGVCAGGPAPSGCPLGTSACDCNCDGNDDDFYAHFPSTLTIVNPTSLPAGIADPSAWGNLEFGPQPPTVSFTPPLCCHSADITFTPSTQPFTAGTPVDIQARVHNLHATSVANNVNVEIRVHNFGNGGAPVTPFPISTVIPTIAASSSTPSPIVTWPSPPAGLHGCIRAEIKAPTTSQYFIAGGGANLAQHNIDVACIPQGQKKDFRFSAFNPELKQEARIILAKQELLPEGLEGLRFELQQPNRPLRPQEEFPVLLTVTAAANLPITQVPKQAAKVPPTSGGTAVPPLKERSGTDPIAIAVKPGDRLHLTASGEVDIDGDGPQPGVGPEGKDFSNELKDERRFLLSGESAGRFAGALIGSFDAFKSSFVAGSEITLTAPQGVEKLWLAVNDLDGRYADNSGGGFDVEVATLPALGVPATAAPRAAQAAPGALPQVNITATTTARVTVGRAVYNLLTNHGGATYQFLVVDAQVHGGVGPFGLPWNLIYLLLLLLLLVLLLFVWLIRRKSRPAS